MVSLGVCLNFQEELKVLLFDGSCLEKDDVDLFNFIVSLENPRDVLDHSIKFKEEGNSAFKGGDIDGAMENYSLSCVFLSHLTLEGEGIRDSFMQLATSVVLNMAAGLLKKKEYKQVGHLCSIILNFIPNNIKALFRRAEAAIGLGKFELASWDLKLAYEVEPTNKEVVRKLREVEESAPIPSDESKGKRKAEQLKRESEKYAKDQVDKVVESNLVESKNSSCNNIDQGDTVLFEVMDFQSMKEIDNGINIDSDRNDKRMVVEENQKMENAVIEIGRTSEVVDNFGLRAKESENRLEEEKPNFHFRHKKKTRTTLAISKREYHLLEKGRTIQHYNPRSGVTMTIRVIGAPQGIKKSPTQPISHPSPMKHNPFNYHNLPANSVSPVSAVHVTDKTKTKLSSPMAEEVKSPNQDTHMLPENPSFTSSPQQNPTFLLSSATDSCSLPLKTITTGHRSPLRRANYRAPKQGVKKHNRVNNRKHSCVLANHVFCRYKVDARVLHSRHHSTSSQNLEGYQIGMKRKSSILQNPDPPVQPRKVVILAENKCLICSPSVLPRSVYVYAGSMPFQTLFQCSAGAKLPT